MLCLSIFVCVSFLHAHVVDKSNFVVQFLFLIYRTYVHKSLSNPETSAMIHNCHWSWERTVVCNVSQSEVALTCYCYFLVKELLCVCVFCDMTLLESEGLLDYEPFFFLILMNIAEKMKNWMKDCFFFNAFETWCYRSMLVCIYLFDAGSLRKCLAKPIIIC